MAKVKRVPLAKIGRAIINLDQIRNVQKVTQLQNGKWELKLIWRDGKEYTFERDTQAEAQAIFDSILIASEVEVITEW